MRRLPVYLMLDCSESMAGPAIEAVGRGVSLLHQELKSNPDALETAYLSVITFSRYAKQVTPLTEVMQFSPPPLSVRTG
ncbi:MAG: tellurium resistance protein TerY, partial [Planctomycetota bacterium]